MNREKIIIELSRISTPTGITPYGDITLDDYTCDEILDYITEQEDENINLKQALNKIREYINRKQIYLSPIDATAIEICRDILQIIDEVGDDE